MALQRLSSPDSRGELDEIITRMKTRRGKPLGYSTGFEKLDRPFGGLVPGQLTYLAARPGMGKTALAMSVARNMTRALLEADDDKHGVFVFSLEMSRYDLLTREALGDSEVNAERYRTGNATDAELERVRVAARNLEAEPLFVDDTAGASLDRIAEAVDEASATVKPTLVIVDHVGLIRVSGNSLYEKVTLASNALKRVAKTYKVPVLALAQLSRKVEDREDKRPILSDLRESGALEQDADNVLLMYRHDYYYPSGTKGHDPKRAGMADVSVAKARNGQSGVVVPLKFDNRRTRFVGV